MSTLPSLLALLLVVLVGLPADASEPYTFFLDGAPASLPRVRIAGSADELAAGDLINVSGIWLTLGPERECRFRTTRDGVLLELPDGSTRWVGVRVQRTYENGLTLIDGLAELSEGQVRGLWGLRAELWSPSCARKVGWLDATRVCLTLGSQDSADLPELPRGLRFLHAGRLLSWENLTRLPALEFLDAVPEQTLDLRLLRGLSQLRVLRLLSVKKLEHTEALADLPSLESLDISNNWKLTDIAFAAHLPRLREIRLSRTSVEDLTPLSGLSLLESVDASATAVLRLADGALPSLRVLDVVNAPVEAEAVAAFRRAHPSVRVRHGWNEAFREASAGATRLRIASSEFAAPPEPRAATLYETTDLAQIAELLELLTVKEDQDGGVCGCLCGPDFEFRRDDSLLATASFACGSAVRWEGWPGDGELPSERIDALLEWLAHRGVTGPRDEAEEDRARAEAHERKTARAVAGLSPALREAFERDGRVVGQTARFPPQASFPPLLEREFPRATDRIRVLLRIYGAENGSWSGLGGEDLYADRLLERYSRRQLVAASEAALLGSERQIRRGAARLWASWPSSRDHRPSELRGSLRSARLTVMQESRSPDLRERALESLRLWWREMPQPEREQRLQAGLCDPDEAVRRAAILVAGRLAERSAEEVLLSVLRDEPVALLPLPPVPAEEDDGPAGRVASRSHAGPLSEIAALALAQMRSARALPLINERSAGSESATLRVARALHDGSCERLVAEDFRSENQPLQLAAVETVVRCQGRSALDLALGYRQATHWWEEEHVAAELRGMLLAAKAPGTSLLRAAKTLPELRGWYQLHGAEYARRVQKRLPQPTGESAAPRTRVDPSS